MMKECEAVKCVAQFFASGMNHLLEAVDYELPSGEKRYKEGMFFCFAERLEDGTYRVRGGVVSDTHVSPRLEGNEEAARHLLHNLRWYEKNVEGG